MRRLWAEESGQTRGAVRVGDSDDAHEIDFAPGKNKETLEANLGDGVKFLLALTLLPHLPGMEPDAKPESSNFKFTNFPDERVPGICHPKANIPDLRR